MAHPVSTGAQAFFRQLERDITDERFSELGDAYARELFNAYEDGRLTIKPAKGETPKTTAELPWNTPPKRLPLPAPPIGAFGPAETVFDPTNNDAMRAVVDQVAAKASPAPATGAIVKAKRKVKSV